jgi:hypothetical protein
MKILITENKRYQLAYKILDDILGGLTREDIDLNKDSVFSNQQIIFRDENDNIFMWWSEKYDLLEVNKVMWEPLRIFSFSGEELESVIHWWIKNRLRMDAEEINLIGDYN